MNKQQQVLYRKLLCQGESPSIAEMLAMNAPPGANVPAGDSINEKLSKRDIRKLKKNAKAAGKTFDGSERYYPTLADHPLDLNAVIKPEVAEKRAVQMRNDAAKAKAARKPMDFAGLC